MKIKIKKSELKKMIAEETSRIFSPEVSPLLEAISELVSLYKESDDNNKKRLDKVFFLMERELMFDKSGKKIKDLIDE